MKTKSQKQQELAKKRADESTKPISVRLNSHEQAIVAEKAAAKGMKPSTYMGYAAAALEQYEPKKACEYTREALQHILTMTTTRHSIVRTSRMRIATIIIRIS